MLFATVGFASTACMMTVEEGSDARLRYSAIAYAEADRLSAVGNHEYAAETFQEAVECIEDLRANDHLHCEEWVYVELSTYYRAALEFAAAGDFKAASEHMSHVADKAKYPFKAVARLRNGQYLKELGNKKEAAREFQRVVNAKEGRKAKEEIPEWIIEEAQAEYDALK